MYSSYRSMYKNNIEREISRNVNTKRILAKVPRAIIFKKTPSNNLEKNTEVKKLYLQRSWKCNKDVESKKCFLFDEDIAKGIEAKPIRLVNRMDNENAPSFIYITHMVNPERFIRPKDSCVGCDCVGGCSDPLKCLCAMKNGGELFFNENKLIPEKKRDIIYECGPHCKCPPSCRNRVSQNGIKFKLEIFKTYTKGWAVRSENNIPTGSFICEYLGEIIKDEKAVKMVDRDEYLFNISNYDHKDEVEKMSSSSASGGGKKVLADYSDSRRFGKYTIDGTYYGNVSRFINHSCSPNLYAQHVLFDHDDSRLSHIMLFAKKDITRMEELTYNYNYKINQVIDSNGNIKMKNCYCGSSECKGRLY